MSLPSTHLDAFQEIARLGSFSHAAKTLYISQSALSQRIKNLEEELGLTLFVRTPTGILLTEQGEKLLRYCQTRDALEKELTQELNTSTLFELGGTLRIGGYSSVLRSVIIPSLTTLLKKNQTLLCEFISASMKELPDLLQRGEVDFIILDHTLDRANLNYEILGQERFVAIEGKSSPSLDKIFLDNNSNDRATEIFFQHQKTAAPKYRRSYFHDCYGIIDGVRAGLGRAVMSEHLIKNDKSLHILKSYKPYNLNVVLHYYKQPFYSKLHQSIIAELKSNAKTFLK